MRDLADEALTIVESLAKGEILSRDDKRRLRELVSEARSTLFDAGYPAEAVWRGLQRASIGVDTLLDQPDAAYWEHVAAELRAGLDTLDSLLSPGPRRETDFHIVS
jgi:hypothetical protein